jgi:hypothetical protein
VGGVIPGVAPKAFPVGAGEVPDPNTWPPGCAAAEFPPPEQPLRPRATVVIKTPAPSTARPLRVVLFERKVPSPTATRPIVAGPHIRLLVLKLNDVYVYHTVS